jgi:hypothetical protein
MEALRLSPQAVDRDDLARIDPFGATLITEYAMPHGNIERLGQSHALNVHEFELQATITCHGFTPLQSVRPVMTRHHQTKATRGAATLATRGAASPPIWARCH